MACLPPRASVIVVGGGFSGAAFALHLMRDFSHLAIRLTVIEPSARLGAGLAYGTTDRQHRINVAAARMSVFAEDPTHFDRWLRAAPTAENDPAIARNGALYPRRRVFGDYMDAMVRDAASRVGAARFEHVRDRAVAAAMWDGRWRLTLACGQMLEADVLVLATGHPSAALPTPLAALRDDQRLLADPWRPDLAQLVRPQDRVLIVGTGLTMMDVLASLDAAAHRGRVVALSRRGLLPHPRTALPVQPGGGFIPAESPRVLTVLRQVREAVRAGHVAGRPWEESFDALRAQAQAIWAVLPDAERRRFRRHLQPFWDVHRYQCAPQMQEVLLRRQVDGTLTVLAAALLRAERAGEAIRVLIRPRHAPAGQALALDFDVLINCTGPAHGAALRTNELLASLQAAGAIGPDPLGLGIHVDPQGRGVDAAGRPQPRLFVVGPPARGAYGELMGLPQVSAQPRDVASKVGAMLMPDDDLGLFPAAAAVADHAGR